MLVLRALCFCLNGCLTIAVRLAESVILRKSSEWCLQRRRKQWIPYLQAFLAVFCFSSLYVIYYQLASNSVPTPTIAVSCITSDIFNFTCETCEKSQSWIPQAALRNRTAWCSQEVEQCRAGKPCRYVTDVDLRVVVLTFNRPCSLSKTLKSVAALHTLRRRVAVHIWVDVPARRLSESQHSSQQQIQTLSPLDNDDDQRHHRVEANEDTLRIADAFVRSYAGGVACVHVQRRHVHITGQWIDTWQPPSSSTKEIALILEDDIDVSPYAYQWLLAVHSQYDAWHNISGYTLQMENTNFFAPDIHPMFGPHSDVAFAYPVIGTWGFSPHPGSWLGFQDWYHTTRAANPSYKPYVSGIVPNDWYQQMELTDKQETMWEMWHIHYTHMMRHWCVYSNLVTFTGLLDVLLSANRQEIGLHFTEKGTENTEYLLRHWEDTFVQFPDSLTMFTYDGDKCKGPNDHLFSSISLEPESFQSDENSAPVRTLDLYSKARLFFSKLLKSSH